MGYSDFKLDRNTIYGFWKAVRFFCGYHNEEMKLTNGAFSVYYACPHETDEPPCHNRLNLVDAERAVQHLIDVYVDDDTAGVVVNLNNHKWKKNGVKFKVLKMDRDMQEVCIEVENEKLMYNT